MANSIIYGSLVAAWSVSYTESSSDTDASRLLLLERCSLVGDGTDREVGARAALEVISY